MENFQYTAGGGNIYIYFLYIYEYEFGCIGEGKRNGLTLPESSLPQGDNLGPREVFLACDSSHGEKREPVNEHLASSAVWNAPKEASSFLSPHPAY